MWDIAIWRTEFPLIGQKEKEREPDVFIPVLPLTVSESELTLPMETGKQGHKPTAI